MSADSGRAQAREAGEQPAQTSALQTVRPGSRASRTVGLVLALLACLWIAFCTGLGPIYRQEGSLTQIGLAQVLIMLGTLAICLALVLACRRILLGCEPLRMPQRLTALAQRPRMRAYAVFITRQTSGWRPIMRLLLLGWAWAFLTLLAAYGADLYAQAQECANFLAQLVLALIIHRRQWSTILIGLLLPLVLFTGVTGALTATGTVIKGDPVESRSIQLQQIARVAQRNPQGIPAQARADLEPIMDLDNAAIQYTPWEADRVKSSGNQPKLIVYRWRTVTPDQLSRLNRAWLQVGLRNPVIYLDAFMAESYGYFDPGDPAYVAMSYYLNNGYVQNSGSWLAAWCHDWRNGVTGFVRTWADTPLLGLVARANFWVVAALLLIVARLAAGHWRGALCWFPLLLIMGVMITAPANNFERHMLPVDMVVPFLILDMVRQSRRARTGNSMDRPT